MIDKLTARNNSLDTIKLNQLNTDMKPQRYASMTKLMDEDDHMFV